MSSARAGFSIVIVNWNHIDELTLCLRSLYDRGADEVQVVVVDNGSIDGGVAVVRREFPAVELIETGTNLGFAAGVDRGLASARGEWVMALNNDAVMLGDGLARARAIAASAAPDVGMLQPTMVFKNRPHHVNSTGINLLSSGLARDRDFGCLDDARAAVAEIFACTAGAGIYRAAMLDQVRLTSGVFDRTYFMYFEDVDLGWRCRLAGWRAFHHPEMRVAHRYQASSQRQGPNWVWRLCKRNHVRTLLKNASPHLLWQARTTVARAVTEAVLRERDCEMHMSDAFRDGWRQRAEVDALIKVPRRSVEARWLTD